MTETPSFLLISTNTPVNVGRESSLPAAIATWLTAVAKRSEFKEPDALGNSGKVGYSTSGKVGSVNLALPALTRTRLPSKLNVIGLAGSDLEISANNLPGTKTFPFWETSALNFALADVSRSEPDKVISSLEEKEERWFEISLKLEG